MAGKKKANTLLEDLYATEDRIRAEVEGYPSIVGARLNQVARAIAGLKDGAWQHTQLNEGDGE